ncbi:MAG: PAQR family membrane homeostasis protein TrhA [Verrucomicrobiota bacterium]
MKTLADVLAADQTPHEELANSLTHGLGLILSIAGFLALLILASVHATAWHVVSFSIYGASLIMLYAVSTLYHSLPSSKIKTIFNMIDHCAIYVLIAGCYTPFSLVTLRGGWGWSLLGVAWSMAILGILLKILYFEKSERFCLFLYLSMGWVIVIALKPLIENLPMAGFILLLCGGLSYSMGILFFKAEKMPFNHAIWHGCVLIGSACHYFCLFYYVLPV